MHCNKSSSTLSISTVLSLGSLVKVGLTSFRNESSIMYWAHAVLQFGGQDSSAHFLSIPGCPLSNRLVMLKVGNILCRWFPALQASVRTMFSDSHWLWPHFPRIGPLGQFCLVVAMYVCLCVVCPFPMRFFSVDRGGASLVRGLVRSVPCLHVEP